MGPDTTEGPKVTYRGVTYTSTTRSTLVETGTLSPDYIYGYGVPAYILNGNRLLLKNPNTNVVFDGVGDGTDEVLLITGPRYTLTNTGKIYGDIGIATAITSSVDLSTVTIMNQGFVDSDTHAIKLQASGLTRLPSAWIDNATGATLASGDGAAIDTRTDFLTITNAGTIESDEMAAIRVRSGSVMITNSGTIGGDSAKAIDATGASWVNLTSSGHLAGGATLSSGNDTVTMSGRQSGVLALGEATTVTPRLAAAVPCS
jgi:hypothetical protein